jgi:hypothetical protein
MATATPTESLSIQHVTGVGPLQLYDLTSDSGKFANYQPHGQLLDHRLLHI